ncbi:hypothetical protein CPLU01_08631 [Colletotrichum plurivorum]|uniref:Uncharacterized protein n=1 Tax=Colletotrichum plurivorum TaxID=2175906 RepID=A0A8H6NCX7_9PEZI|nr:hypothetical protein CPLU01_08631 [Colletotrichum plurivorum]
MVSLHPISEVTEFIIITPAAAPAAPASVHKTLPEAKHAPVVVITSHPDIQKTAIAAKLVEFLGLKQALHVSRDVQFTWDNAGGETNLQWAVRDEDCLAQVIIVTESKLGFTDGFKDAMDHLRIAKDAQRPLLPVLLTQYCKEDGKVLKGFNWDQLPCYEDTKVGALEIDVTEMEPEEVAARILAHLLTRLYTVA